MTITIVSWFVLGCLAGSTTLAIAAIIALSHQDKEFIDTQFVKALIEKKGWEKANEILTFEYSGKYLKIWRKLYREHIEKGENKDEQ